MKCPQQVPLWLAITLSKKHRCHIQQPSWMTVPKLTALLTAERYCDTILVSCFHIEIYQTVLVYFNSLFDPNRKNLDFESIPHHYIEIAALLFDNVPGDIQEADKVRALLEDIENVRQAKVVSLFFLFCC